MKKLTQIIGMVLLAGGLLTLNYLIFDLGRFGTCASGGPYVSARECAPDTGLKIMGLFGAVIAGLLGAALARSARVGLAAWGMLFTSLAITFVMIAYGPAAGDNSFGITAIIVGGVFLLMGIPGLVAAVAPDGATRTLTNSGGSSSGSSSGSSGGGSRPPFMNG